MGLFIELHFFIFLKKSGGEVELLFSREEPQNEKRAHLKPEACRSVGSLSSPRDGRRNKTAVGTTERLVADRCYCRSRWSCYRVERCGLACWLRRTNRTNGAAGDSATVWGVLPHSQWSKYDACYDVGSTFRLNWFLNEAAP